MKLHFDSNHVVDVNKVVHLRKKKRLSSPRGSLRRSLVLTEAEIDSVMTIPYTHSAHEVGGILIEAGAISYRESFRSEGSIQKDPDPSISFLLLPRVPSR